MPAGDRGGLKAAFTNFRRTDSEKEAERKLLGREVADDIHEATEQPSESYPTATSQVAVGGLVPRPLLQREAVRQLSFRCPVSLASELRRKAAFNQLEQQEILIEGIRRVLLDLPEPPQGWEP